MSGAGSLRRDPGLAVLMAALGILLAVLFSHGERLTSDGIDHYVYLRSLFVDHDLDLANDYALVSPRGESDAPETPLGRTGNAHPVGPALVWAPFYVLADLAARFTGASRDGLGPLYLNAVAMASLLYGWLGLMLLYWTAQRGASRSSALLATLGIGFGTFLYFYLTFAPTMAHAPAFGAAALFVWLWLGPLPDGPRRAAWLGAACGLLALLRWANVLIALLPLVEALPRLGRPKQWRRLLEEAAAFGAAALLVFSPQMIVWWRLYGSPLTIPQGSAFLASAPAWDGVLFSPRHGLFSWSPVLYLGAAGLLVWLWRAPWRAAATVVFALALTRVNAGVADWWAGAAFGGRRFDALLPLLGVGLALALEGLAGFARRRPLAPAAVLLGSFVLWNVLLARHYRTGAWDYAGPVPFEDMGRSVVGQIDRAVGSPFSLPASLLEWWRSGRPPADYESLFMLRRYGRWTIRMGDDDRIFLEDGWSEPLDAEGVRTRRLIGGSAGLVAPLHGDRAYRLGARVRLEGAELGRLRVLMNDKVLGSWDLNDAFADYEVPVPVETVRPGRNALRFRRPGEGPWQSEIAVAGVWAEPAQP